MKTLRVRIRLDFGPSRALGPGKIALLEEMRRTGSLSKAARELGMAYRRAWLLLQSLNGLFDEPLARATKGGVGGGGVELTPAGEDLISAYRHLEGAVIRQAKEDFGRFTLAPGTSGSTAESIKRLPRTRSSRKTTAGK